MITRNQFEEIYPLVNEIVAFSDSFANEDNSLFRYFKTMGKVYGSNDLIKIIRSNILSDLLYCYFTLGYQQNYNSNCYVFFDLLQYAFWFDTNHFSYEDFVKYTSSQSNASYFLKGFNNAKRDKNSGLFPALYINLIKVDQLKGAEYLSILKEIAIMLFKNTDEETRQNDEIINALLTYIESSSVSSDDINESNQIYKNRENHMITNQEEYESLHLLVRTIVRFANLFANKADCNSELSKYLKTIGCSFSNNVTLKNYVQIIIGNDILNCYFLLGYQHIYKREFYILHDMVEYCFCISDVPWSYNEFLNVYEIHNNFFCEVFDINRAGTQSYGFPALYIYLSEIKDPRADEYLCILQEIATTLSKNSNGITNNKDPRIDVLLTNPQAFLHSEDIIDESQHIEDNRDIQPVEKESNDYGTDYNFQTMNLLKDKRYNGISFEITKEAYSNGYFKLYLRVTNFTDHRINIKVEMDYISIKHGLKKIWAPQETIPENTFIVFDYSYEDITTAFDGDRIEMIVNDGYFATLRLLRERGQWIIIESIERSTYNKELKNRIEHFEAIDEQFGITLQNFSVKVVDENSLNLFCEVLALNGEVPQKGFNVEVAIYDSENSIIYQTSLSKYDGEFKGFEVFNFGTIRLDIPVDEISKIRIYPTR